MFGRHHRLQANGQAWTVTAAHCTTWRSADGSASSTFRYDEYGVRNGNPGRFGYAGMVTLLGVNYTPGRVYNPALGRFLQTDPIGYGDGLNWYNYVHSDPVNAVDASGLATGSILKGVDTGARTIYPNGFEANNGTGDDGPPVTAEDIAAFLSGFSWDSKGRTKATASEALDYIERHNGYTEVDGAGNFTWVSAGFTLAFDSGGSGIFNGLNFIYTPASFFAHVAEGHFGADTRVDSKFALHFQNPVSIFSLAVFAANHARMRPGDWRDTFTYTALYSGRVGYLRGTGEGTNYVSLIVASLGTRNSAGLPEYKAITMFPGW